MNIMQFVQSFFLTVQKLVFSPNLKRRTVDGINYLGRPCIHKIEIMYVVFHELSFGEMAFNNS